MGELFRLPARHSMLLVALRGVAVCAAAAVLCVALGAGVSSRAQTQLQVPGQDAKTMLVEPPTPLLPATLGKLKRVAEGEVGDGLGVVDAADATVMTEDGLRRFARSDYAAISDKNALPQGSVAVYRFGDASGAVAAYDYFRRPGMRPEKIGDQALSNGDELLLRSGVNVVAGQFKLDHEAMLALTRELIVHLPKVSGSAAIAPLLPELLPVKGLDADSLRYALGPADYRATGGVLPAEMVGFDKSAEAVTAKYKGGGLLTLLLYPTPEIAGEHERAIESLSRQQGESLAGTVKLRRDGTLLVLTSGAWTVDEAQKMVDGIHLRSEVTWNKPVPLDYQTEVRKTFSLLVSITIFCCLAFLAAIVLALFLGGGRALVRVMQGKSAATEPEFLRIDLSGPSDKRLEGSED
jgi:hypothetical protein